jgi:hypothetical protein
MKSIGTKKEVYLGNALKTSSGMTRADIIKTVKDKAIKVYISKKISNKMKYKNPRIPYKKHTKKKEATLGKLNVSDLKERLIRERKLQRIKRRKLKSLKSTSVDKIKGKGIKNKKTNRSNKLSFALNKNKIKEFYCAGLNEKDDTFSTTSFNGYERDDENDEDTDYRYNNQIEKIKFKIEEPPNISLDELFI